MRIDGEIPLTFKEIIRRDRASYEAYLLKHCLIPQYKARKLWNLGYSEADVVAGRHFEQFPSWDYSRKREIKTEQPVFTRGKALSRKAIELRMVRAMRMRAQEILAGHSLPIVDREWLKGVIAALLQRETKLKEKT